MNNIEARKSLRAKDYLKTSSKHSFRAECVEGKGIEVRDKEGNLVDVSYAGTRDMRTAYAHVAGIGFIGGWQYPHQAGTFKKDLVQSINRGVVYREISDLPSRRRR